MTVVTILMVALAYALHRWIGVRREHLDPRFSDDTSIGKAWIWAKSRWDFVIAAFVTILPVIWSSSLDIIVIVANLLASWAPSLASLDLSNLMITDRTKLYIQMAGVMLPPIRDVIEKARRAPP